MQKLPTISIVTCILNPDMLIFKLALESVKIQSYPKKLIEHLVIDGGSTNKAPTLGREYGCKVIVRKDLKDKDTVRASIGIQKSKGRLVLILESDNILISKDWLRKMVQPFIDDKNIFCTFSAYNSYYKWMPPTTRYCALFGTPDPTLYYLNKTEKIRIDQDNYNKGQTIKKAKGYNVVIFNNSNLPTLGDNGHMFLRSIIQKVNKNPKLYLHTDAFSKLIDLGYNKFGVVMNSIIHVQNPNIISLMKRRIQVKRDFYDKYRGQRKYLVFNVSSTKDRINLIKFVLLSITIIFPLLESIRGYIKIKDTAWFLHPVICLLMVFGYGLSEIKCYLRKPFLK